MLRLRTIADIDEETVLAERLSAFLDEERGLFGPIIRELDRRNLHFAITPETNGVTEPGMVLFDRASLHLPHHHVTLGVSWNDPTAREETLVDRTGDRSTIATTGRSVPRNIASP